MNIMISIVIPVYNVDMYLRECVNSVLMQSYKHIEIILVDDGSTDNSGKICDEYAKNDIRIKAYHKENGGLSDARNFGLLRASGEYICYIDSDDYWNSDFLYKIVKIIEENSAVKVIGCRGFELLFSNKKQLQTQNLERNGIKQKDGKDVLKYILSRSLMPFWSAWRYFFSREFLLDNKLLFVKGILNEDAELIPKIILQADNIDYYDGVYYTYRQQRDGSIMNTISYKRVKEYFDITINWYNVITNGDYDQTLKNLLISCFANIFCDYFTHVYYFSFQERQQLIGLIKNNKYLLKYANNGKIKYKKYLVLIFGINISLRLFNYFTRTKKIIKKLIKGKSYAF